MRAKNKGRLRTRKTKHDLSKFKTSRGGELACDPHGRRPQPQQRACSRECRAARTAIAARPAFRADVLADRFNWSIRKLFSSIVRKRKAWAAARPSTPSSPYLVVAALPTKFSKGL